MITTIELAKRVQNGITFLDAACPGWAEKIDLDNLDMRNHNQCVLGQLIGDFFKLNLGPRLDTDEFHEVFGFGILKLMSVDIQELERMWRQEIAKRQEEAS